MLHDIVPTLHRIVPAYLHEIGAGLLAVDLMLFILLLIFWKKAEPPSRPKPGRRL